MAIHAREGHKARRHEPYVTPAAAPADAPPQSPLDFAETVFRDPAQPMALRASLAKAAMAYVHGRWSLPGMDPREAKRRPRSAFGFLDADDCPAVPLQGADEPDVDAQPAVHEAHDDSLSRHGRACPGHPRLSLNGDQNGDQDVDGSNACGHDENEGRGLAAEAEQRAIAAEAQVRDMQARAHAGEARVAELEAREIAREALLARLKAQWPEMFDASGAVRAPGTGEGDRLAQLLEAQERARSLEKRAVAAEGRLREAQMRARDMEERALASEALIAGRRESGGERWQ